MGEASKGQSRPPEFLSTHPSDDTRVTRIEGWLPQAKKYYQPAR
jgi:predicted Zn-dependent protease